MNILFYEEPFDTFFSEGYKLRKKETYFSQVIARVMHFQYSHFITLKLCFNYEVSKIIELKHQRMKNEAL